MKARVISSDRVPRMHCYDGDGNVCGMVGCERRNTCIQAKPVGRVSLEKGVVWEDGRREGGVSMRGW
ncbi:hypothetical protein KKC08_02930 [Patescibacteria group bacterium]|nr:hypothetical protein [Patescibacteria group bacterium]MCG2701658.1 hypothetical protein [Candidatus Parcubacteria bacterium]MBU4265006.1 hypothetical protein [Patescibacteria group bacterium]MBU4390159.1 hypothetical protein [Patescibacteria group bacterium]MBU4397092.1 hypothetical protein [Patescibacteria group bacterium]